MPVPSVVIAQRKRAMPENTARIAITGTAYQNVGCAVFSLISPTTSASTVQRVVP